jgi:hypothetical protein
MRADDASASKAALDKTPLGFKVLRWDLDLGEQLARHQVPFMSRAVRIASLRDALMASSIMMRLWRTNPDAPKAVTKAGVTALHFAVEHQVWFGVCFGLKLIACWHCIPDCFGWADRVCEVALIGSWQFSGRMCCYIQKARYTCFR